MADLDYLKRNVFPGESGGDYDALFGYSNRRGPFAGIRPTEMTVNEVLQFTDPSGPYAQWVKGQVGRVATPVGAYQVVGSTLRDAVKGLGLTGNERFDQNTQDAIGMWIYQNQGPAAWEGWNKGGGQARLSTSGGPSMVGLLDMMQGQEPEKQPFMERLALAANTLRMNPDQNLATMLQQRQEQRAQTATANRTAQWLISQNRQDLAQAMLTGAIDPKTAATLALEQPDAVNGVEVGGKLVNPRTGEIIYDPTNGAAPQLTSDQLSGLNTLRDDAVKATTEFSLMKDAWGNIQTFYQNPGSVSDKSLVVAFAKILDPTSVVRESESAAIANAGSLSAGMRSTLINTLQGGGNLPPEVRNEIVRLSAQMVQTKLPAAERAIEGLRRTAKAAGLPEDLVFFGDLTAPPAPLPPPPQGGGQITPPPSFTPATGP